MAPAVAITKITITQNTIVVILTAPPSLAQRVRLNTRRRPCQQREDVCVFVYYVLLSYTLSKSFHWSYR